ncbi:hypothetical protein D3C76_1176060 [compost metagenome]
MLLHYRRADAENDRSIAGKTGDFGTVAKHELRFFGRQGVERCLDLLCGLHQLRFLIGAGSVVRIAQHDHRTGFEIASIRVERLELAHSGVLARREKSGLQLFAGHAVGENVKAGVR